MIPVNEGKMPVAYGYLEGIFNLEEKEENSHIDFLDVLVFSSKEFLVGEEASVEVLGILTREDGDHKIVAFDKTYPVRSWEDIS